MLSRQFVEYILWGWDNLPRIVLMYYANFLSSPEGYFHTVICNAEEFRNTTVNHDLHFISWDNPPKQHPHYLTVNNYQKMVESNAPFARKFGRNESVLDKIDIELLGRNADGYVPGRWFSQANPNTTKSYSGIRNITELRPGPGAGRLKRLINGLLSSEEFLTKQCSWHPGSKRLLYAHCCFFHHSAATGKGLLCPVVTGGFALRQNREDKKTEQNIEDCFFTSDLYFTLILTGPQICSQYVPIGSHDLLNFYRMTMTSHQWDWCTL